MDRKALVFILILFLINLAIAAHTITTSVGGTSYDVNEDSSFLYNISVENADSVETANITQVEMTIPSSFSFLAGSNGSDTTNSFSSTSTVLTWSNDPLVMNLTTNYFWFNLTASTPGDYNITVVTTNSTGIFSSNISVSVNDTTNPSITFIDPSSMNSSKQDMVLNVTASDNGDLDTIILNLYNITEDEINSSSSSSSPLYANFTQGLSEGTYYVNATANDTNGNIVVSDTMNITLDNTDPSISFSCSPSTANLEQTVTCTCTGSDNLDADPSESFTENPDTDASGTFTTTCTVTDDAGNSVSSDFEYRVRSDPSGSSSSSTTDSGDWDATFVVSDEQFIEGYSKSLEEKERLKVRVDGEEHYVGIIDWDEDKVVINVSSIPQQAEFNVGDSKRFEVSNDSYYDILVTLVEIDADNEEAKINVRSIHEEFEDRSQTTIANGVEDTGDAAGSNGETGELDDEINRGNKSWIVWLITVIILIAIVIVSFVLYNKYKSHRYYHRGY